MTTIDDQLTPDPPDFDPSSLIADDIPNDDPGFIFEDDPFGDDVPDVGIIHSTSGPDVNLIDKPKRSPKATQYEKKLRRQLSLGFRLAVMDARTLPDAANIIVNGPQLAETWGDLAAHDPRVARGIDMVFSDGIENPWLTAVLATVTFGMQAFRNHEPSAEAIKEGIRIPFTQRRIRMRFKIRIPWMKRAYEARTEHPPALVSKVFSDPIVLARMEKAGFRFTNVD